MGKELAYLYTNARNLCTDYYRRKKPLPLTEEIEAENRPEQLLDSLDVQRAVEKLAPEEQERIFLRYVNELKAGMGRIGFGVYRRFQAG